MVKRISLVISLVLTLSVLAGVRFSVLLGLGLTIGFILERYGFGFAGPWRRLIRDRDDGPRVGLISRSAGDVDLAPPKDLDDAQAQAERVE